MDIPLFLIPRSNTYCTPLRAPFIAELVVLAPIGDPLLSTRPNLGAAGDEKFDLRFTEPPFKGRLVAEPGVNPSSLKKSQFTNHIQDTFVLVIAYIPNISVPAAARGVPAAWGLLSACRPDLARLSRSSAS